MPVRTGGYTIPEIERRIDERMMAASPMTVRCGLCNWTESGPADVVLGLQTDHIKLHKIVRRTVRQIANEQKKAKASVRFEPISQRANEARRNPLRRSRANPVKVYAATHCQYPRCGKELAQDRHPSTRYCGPTHKVEDFRRRKRDAQ